MNILALDSSGKNAGVCILQSGQPAYVKTLKEELTHSQTLALLVKTAMEENGLCPADISLVGISAGPGSFTGLRIGMAFAKGFCQPLGINIAPVSTLQALAQAVCAEQNTALEEPLILLPALDARRGEVYSAAFLWQNGSLSRLCKDRALPAENAANGLDKKDLKHLIFGDGAKICYNALYGKINARLYDGAAHIALGAACCAQSMHQNGQSLPAEKAVPVYLRLSQAERQRQAAAMPKA